MMIASPTESPVALQNPRIPRSPEYPAEALPIAIYY